MKTRTSMNYLMSFEQMMKFLENHAVQLKESQMGCPQTISPLTIHCGCSATAFNDLREKLTGTWWEIESADVGQMPFQCFYLADSLQDALRLRPDIDLSYWSSNEENADQFLSEIAAWQEDDYSSCL